MPAAPNLCGAFVFGEGVHAYVKPNGHYMNDVWFYDINAHRWVCLYPGIEVKTVASKIKDKGKLDKAKVPKPKMHVAPKAAAGAHAAAPDAEEGGAHGVSGVEGKEGAEHAHRHQGAVRADRGDVGQGKPGTRCAEAQAQREIATHRVAGHHHRAQREAFGDLARRVQDLVDAV